jgi:hypothetical protein
MQHTFRHLSISFGAIALIAIGLLAVNAQRADASETTFTAAARTCPDGKKWRYRDKDLDKLGNPSKRKRICREFPREGYVTNRRDNNDNIAQFGFKGQKRGWIRINLRDSSRSYYRFRAFTTPRAQKKVKVIRYEKYGKKRNRLIAIAPKGKKIKFIDYATGFTWHSKKISSKKWNGRFVGLQDFNGDAKPEVVVVLKRGSVVRVKVLRFVGGKGFTKVANLKLTDAESVLPRATLTDENNIALVSTAGDLVKLISFDSDSFTLTDTDAFGASGK